MATEILRPDNPGDECNIGTQVGCSICPNHYDCVDEVIADDTSTYVKSSGADGNWKRDLYHIENSAGSGVINSITVYARVRRSSNDYQATHKIAIKTGGVVYETEERSMGTGWEDKFEQWVNNPGNAHAWTWAEIDALQIGVSLKHRTGSPLDYPGACTQMWVVVDYTPAPPAELENKSANMGSKMVAAGLI